MKKVLFLLLLVAGQANASGYAYRSTYYPSGNYYYGAGNYPATAYYGAGYYPAGNYYYPSGYYYPVTSYVEPSISYTEPDWRRKVVDLLITQTKYEAQARASALEHNAFIETMSVLGLKGINYGNQQIRYPGAYFPTPVGNYGVSGNTFYGYTYSSVADVYGSTDLNALYQQASRLTANAQSLAGQAHTDTIDLIGREGANRARVAEILAKAELLRSSVTPSATVENKVFSFKFGSDGKLVPLNQEPKSGGDLKAWAVVAQKCINCHNGKTIKGNFDVANYPSMNAEQKASVLRRINSDDPKIRMPKDGPPLSPYERKVWADL